MPIQEVPLAEFARSFSLRAPRLHLLLGAGASVSSGVPSAEGMVWDFKRQLYATETNVSVDRVAPLADPAMRITLQRYFDAKSGYPPQDDDGEYAFYFAKAYPNSHDRRLYIAKALKDKKPSYGYICLAVLLAAGKVRQIWTPNFDDLLERAFSLVADGKAASLVGLDTTARLSTYLRDERYPIVVKLHGDFRYDDLRNVAAEVAEMDAQLRDALIEASKYYGLFVIGYSGRDTSVMSAINTAVAKHGKEAFKDGLFWSLREDEGLGEQAQKVLEEAASLGIPTSVVRISDFDDVATSLYRVLRVSSPIVEERLVARKDLRQGFTLYKGPQRDPVLKTNAVPVVAYPDTCYRFRSSIKGWKDLRAIGSGTPIIAALHKGSVLALGTQSEINTVFASRGVDDLQPAALTTDDLRVPDSVVIGMFYDAIATGLTTDGVLSSAGIRSRILYFAGTTAVSEDTKKAYTDLKLSTGPKLIRAAHEYWIHEAAEISPDFRDERLWLLIRPTVMLTADGATATWKNDNKQEVIRELLATRYNQPVSGLLNFWLTVILDRTDGGWLTFPPAAETGFRFRLGRALGYSYHQG